MSLSYPPSLFTDGGLIRRNPSPDGGAWAWCRVNGNGERVWTESGLVLPETSDWLPAWKPGLFARDDAHRPDPRHLVIWPDDEISNNVTEFVAALLALEAQRDGWTGKVCPDSRVTLERFARIARGHWIDGLTRDWNERARAALDRLGALQWVLHQGHPTAAELATGFGKRGDPLRAPLPVSEHNKAVDLACTTTMRVFGAACRAYPNAPLPVSGTPTRPLTNVIDLTAWKESRTA